MFPIPSLPSRTHYERFVLGPLPKSPGEASLDKEVPTLKMFSSCIYQNLMVRGMLRDEPTVTLEEEILPRSPKEA